VAVPARSGGRAGFAHGQAGIACALWRLAGATSSARFVEAANEAAAYERHVLGTDFEGTLDDEPVAAWSHGATGIGLSRLTGVAVTDDAAVRSDLDAALRHAEAHLLDGADPLCCGGAGRISLLLGAGRALDRPDLREAGRRGAARLCSRIRRRGACRLAWSREIFDTGFFQGSAGVAYTLLRVAWPQSIPSVPLAA
jgi:Lantibiotic modifying enzyme